MYRGLIYIGRRGIALHALSGIDIALWDIAGKAEGKPVCELIGTPKRDKVRAYASMLMPDEPGEVRERVSELREQGFTAIKLGWGRSAPIPRKDVELAAAAVEAAGEGGTILIDAGLGYGRDAKTAIGVARAARRARRLLARGAVRARRVRGLRGARGRGRDPRRRRRAGHDALGLPRADRAGPRRPRSARRHALRRHHRAPPNRGFAQARGVETVPHAWKSGIIKAASLHVNAVLPDALFQEYCVADTPINTSLTRQRLPIDAEGFVAVPDRARARDRARRRGAGRVPR